MVEDSPFTTREAIAAGMSRGQLRGSRWRAPFSGVRVAVDSTDDLLSRCQAMTRLLPSAAVFGELTAAKLHQWWLPPTDETRDLDVIVPAVAPRTRRRGVRCRRADVDSANVVVHAGLRITSPARTLVDLAARLPLIDLVVAMDSALHAGHCQPADLARSADWSGRGVRMFRRALALADGRSESPMETLLRLLLVLSGLPAPIPQVVIRNTDGRFLARADLKARGVRAILEYDGAVHDQPQTHARDVVRWRELRAAGYEVFPYTARELYREPHRIVTDYQRTLGLPVDAMTVRGWVREWRLSNFRN